MFKCDLDRVGPGIGKPYVRGNSAGAELFTALHELPQATVAHHIGRGMLVTVPGNPCYQLHSVVAAQGQSEWIVFPVPRELLLSETYRRAEQRVEIRLRAF